MPNPKNLLTLVDLLARLGQGSPDTVVFTDQREILSMPMAGMSSNPEDLAEITFNAYPQRSTEVQTAESLTVMLAPFANVEATHTKAGSQSPLVIAPLGGAASWITDISYENGRFTLHTVRM